MVSVRLSAMSSKMCYAGRMFCASCRPGWGKSFCYEWPGAISEGLTLVVSPLISLMEDQVQQLRDEGIAACLLNSSLSPALRRQTLAELERGFSGLLYIAPERFVAPDF